jgi:uncharacterized membrane protein YkvA (DUF1232 family)
MTLEVKKNNKLEMAKAWLGAKAESIASEPQKIKKLWESAYEKVGGLSDHPQLKKLIEPLSIFKRMTKAHYEGRYKVPAKSLVLICLGLLYFVLPTDFAPDFIPFFGYVDDFSVLIAIFNKLKTEIDEFLVWEQSKNIQYD